ncbi:MAG: histidine kinase [Cellvibrio sp.]|nr:histidine kinase [Cellvibrio sp.]
MPTHISSYAKLYNPQKLMRVYTYYRLALVGVLFLLLQLDFSPKLFNKQESQVFYYTCIFYAFINLLTLFLAAKNNLFNTQKLPFVSLTIDVAIISALMHLSGGPLSGMGYLLLIPIAAGGMMLRERTVIFLAAINTVVIISEGLYRYFFLGTDDRSLFSSALLGTLSFITAISFFYFSEKLRKSDAAALTQAEHIAHLQRTAQLILERMRTGIMVLNNQQDIELYNKAAKRLLDLPDQQNDLQHLSQLPELYDKWKSWKEGLADHTPLLSLPKHITSEIKVNFAQLEPGNSEDLLVFLEDVRALHQQAQQLKLASLGRLTASIAHEIRNPLGAISHASQLLSESARLDESDHRLLEIIQNHGKRVNSIIENILQLSRRRASQPEKVDLLKWLPHFIQEYKTSIKNGNSVSIELMEKNIGISQFTGDFDDHSRDSLIAKFDPSQLQQVLTNLCDNGLRYTLHQDGKPALRIETGTDNFQQQPYIRVIDFGTGIAKDIAEHLFEPFFTTENTGSGLGLYICKELCEANQAFINYQFTADGESCFHIQLSHPDKLQ